MPWAAAVIAGGAILGSSIAGNASQSAAQTQANAADQASATQLQMFNQTQQNVAPWLASGQSSLAQLIAGTQNGSLMPTPYTPMAPWSMDQFHQDPGYQFQLQQGENALTNAASISGGMNSNNLKGLLGYSQGLANTDYQQAFNNYNTQLGNYMQQFQLGNQTKQQGYNNLAGLSAQGLGAGLNQGQISANVAQNVGSNIIGAGNAQAAGQVGVSNAFNGGMGNAYNQWLQAQYLQMAQNGGYGPFSPSGGSGL